MSDYNIDSSKKPVLEYDPSRVVAILNNKEFKNINQ